MKLAVIGLGSIGRRHLGNLNTIGMAPLVAYDADPAQRAAAAKQFPFATIATSLEQALDGAAGVAVCTPPVSHVEIARQAAERGAHLMVEKPFAVTGDGVPELLRSCDARGLTVLTAYNWHFSPPMLLIERLLREGRIGPLRAARTEYAYHLATRYKDYRTSYMADARQGGGCLLDESHAIDYMTWLLGDVVELTAFVDRLALETTSDDVADLTVRFASGVLGNIHMDLFSWSVNCQFHMLGDAGVIQWRRFDQEPVRLYDTATGRWEGYPFSSQLNDMYVDEVRHWVACIRGEAKPACDGWAGLKTMRIIEAARRSSAERRWITVQRD